MKDFSLMQCFSTYFAVALAMVARSTTPSMCTGTVRQPYQLCIKFLQNRFLVSFYTLEVMTYVPPITLGQSIGTRISPSASISCIPDTLSQ
jgi:hypothetical protein